MIYALVFIGALKRRDILRSLHNAYCSLIPRIVRAYRTKLSLSQVLTFGAASDRFVSTDKSVSKSPDILVCHTHNVICKPLCAFHAYSGQLGKLLSKKHKRKRGIISHRTPPL